MTPETIFCINWLRRFAPESSVLRFSFELTQTPAAASPPDEARATAAERPEVEERVSEHQHLKRAHLDHARRVELLLRNGSDNSCA
jgi:hypothetical protein